MESYSNLVVFTSEDLKSFTNSFHQKNLIGDTQFGKLFRGCIRNLTGVICTQENRDVTVKIWDEKSNCLNLDSDEHLMIKEEVKFLTHPSIHCHPNLVKLIGFCCEKEVRGVVYDLNPRDILHNIILKDVLSWTQRDCNIKLCDFGLISGGIIGEISALKKQITIPIGYVDPFFAAKGGYWQTGSDVFSFGVILLGLISTRVLGLERPKLIPDNVIHIWAKNEYKPNCSLVHKSLTEDWGYHGEDGSTITEVGMRCIEFFPTNRPAMKDVLERLKGLMVFQRFGDTRPNKRDKKFHIDFDMAT
ncbi:probable serine/threonine-protein kinase PBL16 isoform X2 [Cannabis sativa]|uniref:probable serine/threonine-protein kinase PBL16 isoform X2 n=1 Tax=Cannabis sativa TaxID=3483 RepID=UPI0029CA5CAD|nr:probable serine/threonine-protein kinase PBL16 isoform X2 [Cannabis sativa]